MITIIADDITGAAEVAGVCLRYGLSVQFGIQTVPEGEADVQVIATDSRSLPLEEAVRIHTDLASKLDTCDPDLLFKKTDSVLRGHVIAELEALCGTIGITSVVLEPANPEVGRTIQNGRYRVEGKPLHETDFRLDPDFPAFTDEVEALLHQRLLDALTSSVPVPEPDRGESNQQGGMAFNHRNESANFAPGLIPPGVASSPKPLATIQLLIPDCVIPDDLRKSVSSSKKLHAGSAAFLAAWLEVKHGAVVSSAVSDEEPRAGVQPLKNRFLMVCGSKHVRSAEYQAASRKNGLAVASFPEPFLKEEIRDNQFDNWADQQADFWGQTGQMLLCFGPVTADFPHSGAVLGQRMARVVQRILQAGFVGELLLEGGATAFAVLRLLGWQALQPLQELAPGVVRMAVESAPGIFITLKPGSYAWPTGQTSCVEGSVNPQNKES